MSSYETQDNRRNDKSGTRQNVETNCLSFTVTVFDYLCEQHIVDYFCVDDIYSRRI